MRPYDLGLRPIVSPEGWLRFSNSQGNCIEVCQDCESGRVRIRETTLPRHVVEVHSGAWDDFLRRCRSGFVPEVYPDGGMVAMLIVDVYGPGRWHLLITDERDQCAYAREQHADVHDLAPVALGELVAGDRGAFERVEALLDRLGAGGCGGAVLFYAAHEVGVAGIDVVQALDDERDLAVQPGEAGLDDAAQRGQGDVDAAGLLDHAGSSLVVLARSTNPREDQPSV
ncbi:hypothetical protein GCM10018965_073770 [Nonomuraea roseola]